MVNLQFKNALFLKQDSAFLFGFIISTIYLTINQRPIKNLKGGTL